MNGGYFLNPRPLKSGVGETALNISGFNSLTLYVFANPWDPNEHSGEWNTN